MSRILEADEQGALTIPSDVLAEPAPHRRYTVDRCGDSLQVTPVENARRSTVGHEDRMQRWRELGKRVAKASLTDRPSEEIISEMRR